MSEDNQDNVRGEIEKEIDAAVYKPNDDAENKLVELSQRRKDYIDVLKQIDESIMQLRYGVSQELVREGSNGCNGFGVGCDMTDYTCRVLCKTDIREACKQIVLQNLKDKDDARKILSSDTNSVAEDHPYLTRPPRGTA